VVRKVIAYAIWLFVVVAGVGVPIWIAVDNDPRLGIPVGIVLGLIVIGLAVLLISYKRRGGK
jgi:hypothetical protein